MTHHADQGNTPNPWVPSGSLPSHPSVGDHLSEFYGNNFQAFLYEFNSFFACQGLLFSLLHPALYTRKLTCMNCINRLLFLSGFQLHLVNGEVRGRRKRQDISLLWLLCYGISPRDMCVCVSLCVCVCI